MTEEFQRYMLKTTVQHREGKFRYTFYYPITKPGTDQYPASGTWIEPVFNVGGAEKLTVQFPGTIHTFEKVLWNELYAHLTQAYSKENLATGEIIVIDQEK